MKEPPRVSISDRAFVFGPFTLQRAQKLLLENEQPVRLGSRALDILIALVERAGTLVGNEELVAIVWPRTVVEESSLRVHVAALRKVLGDGRAGARYIVNQPGRGYSFVAPVTRSQEGGCEVGSPCAGDRLRRPPAPSTRMIGRDESMALLAEQFEEQRFVTLVGPGGIGKTTMALALADSVGATFEHEPCFVDLAPVASGQLILAALMSGLGLSSSATDEIEAFMRGRRMLIVFDSCEHLLDALTPLVEQLLRCAPGLHVLATSREPMRAEGECVHRLGALALPPPGGPPTAAKALRYPSVELFVEHAASSVDDFVLTDADASVVGDLCRRLDGNPLALELAAARVDLFGLHGLSAQLDAHVLNLKNLRRGAPPWHRTLSAMLERSFLLLPDVERLVLKRLAVFQGWFALREATDFVRGTVSTEGLLEDEVIDGIANLTAKSLLVSDASHDVVHFRLLELTRAYVLIDLDSLDERAFLPVGMRCESLTWVALPHQTKLRIASGNSSAAACDS